MFDGKDLEQRMGIERVLQNGMQHNCVNSKCCWAKNIDLKSQTDNRQSHQMDLHISSTTRKSTTNHLVLLIFRCRNSIFIAPFSSCGIFFWFDSFLFCFCISENGSLFQFFATGINIGVKPEKYLFWLCTISLLLSLCVGNYWIGLNSSRNSKELERFESYQS